MAPGLKRRELTPCALCAKGLAKGGPIVYRVQLERFVLNPQAIQQAAGLEMMIGPALANIMGTDADLAAHLDTDAMLVCGDCVMRMPQLLRDSNERGEESPGR